MSDDMMKRIRDEQIFNKENNISNVIKNEQK